MPVRLFRRFVRPVEPNFEQNWRRVYQEWLFRTYLADAEQIFEFEQAFGLGGVDQWNRDRGGFRGVETHRRVVPCRLEDDFGHLANRNARSVSDVDRIAGGVPVDRQQAAARKMFDVEKVADFVTGCPLQV